MRVATAIVLLCLAGPCFAEEDTAARYIFEINIDGDTTVTHYFKAAAGPSPSPAATWGSPSCPNAQYAYTRALAGQKDILAVAMNAIAMGRPVVFRGACDTTGNYFLATRIIVVQ